MILDVLLQWYSSNFTFLFFAIPQCLSGISPLNTIKLIFLKAAPVHYCSNIKIWQTLRGLRNLLSI